METIVRVHNTLKIKRTVGDKEFAIECPEVGCIVSRHSDNSGRKETLAVVRIISDQREVREIELHHIISINCDNVVYGDYSVTIRPYFKDSVVWNYTNTNSLDRFVFDEYVKFDAGCDK